MRRIRKPTSTMVSAAPIRYSNPAVANELMFSRCAIFSYERLRKIAEIIVKIQNAPRMTKNTPENAKVPGAKGPATDQVNTVSAKTIAKTTAPITAVIPARRASSNMVLS